jgi:hypothetical protein
MVTAREVRYGVDLAQSTHPPQDIAQEQIPGCSDSHAISEGYREDPLACIDATMKEDEGESCELHIYEHRYNSRGMMVAVEVGAMERLPFEASVNPQAALVLIRTYDQAKSLKGTTLQIRSPYMKKALRDVIKTYPGVNFDSAGPVLISGSSAPHCVFHYRRELENYAVASEDDDIKEHIIFLLAYMIRAVRKETDNCRAMMELSPKEMLRFDDLWMAFRPGDLVCFTEGNFKLPSIMRLRSFDRVCMQPTPSSAETIHWQVAGEVMDCDGTHVAISITSLKLSKYDGYRALGELDIMPLKYSEDETQIRKELYLRGKKWLALTGPFYHRSYSGDVCLIALDDSSNRGGFPPVSQYGRCIAFVKYR